MQNISIRIPNESDIKELRSLFRITITDNFKKENIENDIVGLEGEVSSKDEQLSVYLKSKGKERFFLIACCNEKIVGTVSYGKCSELIMELSNGTLKDVGEIGSVYVLPEFQKKGVGTLLMNSIFIYLLSRGIEEFSLDSGYAIAKRIWTSKFGEPDIIKKDYWAEGCDHYIWHRKTEDMEVNYSISK